MNNWQFIACPALRDCAVMATQGWTRCSAPPPITMLSPSFYSALARTIPAGEPAVEAVAARICGTLGENWRWIRGLAGRYVQKFDSQARPRRRDVIEFLCADEGLLYAAHKYKAQLRIAQWVSEPARAACAGCACVAGAGD